MIELQKGDFDCVRSLLNYKEGYMESKAVIEKNNPGWVFVDSYPNPKYILIWSQGNNGFYLLGNEINNYYKEINHFIDSYIKSKLQSIGVNYLEISTVPPITDYELKDLFKFRILDSWEQSVYQYNKKNKIQNINNNYLYDIKDILQKEYNIKNIGFIKNKILNYWDSIETFFEKADGFCILTENDVVSIALTGWIAGNVHQISIETIENQKQKGYGKICSSALFNRYLEKGIIPYWECEKNNIASVKIVEQLCFSKLFDYTCYGFSI
jgi:hypothetical protein